MTGKVNPESGRDKDEYRVGVKIALKLSVLKFRIKTHSQKVQEICWLQIFGD